MAKLAEGVAGEHSLDFSVGSVREFENIVRRDRRRRAQLLVTWGAYFGEVLRRASKAKPRWRDYETVAKTNSIVAALDYGPDVSALLVSDATVLLPIAKVAKFLDSGSQDSPAAFAPVALNMLRPAAATPAPAEVSRDALNPEATVLFESFFHAPSLETLRNLRASRTSLRGREAAFLARELGARPEQLYPFFAEAPVGRGYQKFDAGNVAARNVWLLLSHGVADRVHTSEALMAMLGDDSKHVRRNAAYVLGRVWLDGDMARFEHCFDNGDAEVRLGLLDSLGSLVGDAVMKRADYSEIAPHARVLRAGLAGTSKHRNEALDTVHQIAVR